MDSLIQKAQQLAQKTCKPIQSISKRIAYVVSHGQSYASNGYAIRTQGVAQALNQQGMEVICFVRPGRPWELTTASAIKIAPEVQVQGVRYIHSRHDQKPSDALVRLERDVEQYIELFRVYKPEVVLAASNYSVGLPAWVAAQRLGLPFYNEVRGFWELSRDAREPGYAQTAAFKQEAERDAFVAQQALKVFTLNHAMKEELIRRGVEANKIELVPNGVSQLPDIKPADPLLKQKLGINESDKVIGYIGSFNAYEGLDTLIEACAALVEQGEPIKLLLVGDDQPLTAGATTELAKLFKEAPAWLVQVGRVSHEQIVDYYALVDVVVVPRKRHAVCEIVQPMKVVEALAYGKRIVVSDVGPLIEYTKKNEGVLSFEANNKQALAQTIQKSLRQINHPKLSNLSKLLTVAQVEPVLRSLSNQLAKPVILSPVVPLRDVSSIDYATATNWFYRQGIITDTLRALESLQKRGVKFDKPKRDFYAFVAGLARLKEGWPVPPRQPNAGLLTRRQHVLYCLHQSVPHATNGYATRSHGVAVGLQQAGFKVRATTRPGFPWDAGIKGLKKGYHELEAEGVSYAACAGWDINKTPLDYYLAEAADHYLREAQTSGAEIIVAASNHVTALPALMAARRLGLPFVYEVRGLWEVTQASVQLEWADSERYHLMRKLEQQAALEADLVIALTEELADELASWGVPRDRIEIVPNAVNAERFKPATADTTVLQQLEIKPDVPVIGYAGSAVAYEGLELLIEALANLKQNGQDFVFVLVGDGKVIDTVKAKAKELGIEDKCRFTGRVPFEQVPSYLACMDILPIPRLSSAVTEMVSALKPLEAMAMGKALVLSDVSPHLTMAGPRGERARLFKKGDAQSLSDALQALIDSPAERQRLGQAARKWVEQERTWNYVTHRYAEALHRVRRIRAIEQNVIPAGIKRLDQITLGLIADQFTTDTLASAVNVLPLSPENWREQLENHPIDALFVESAWKGNNEQWHRKVGYYSDEEFAPLSELLAYCRNQKIPSLFWNKEDPVHFERFRKAASLCDHVFTTDSRRIIPYLSTPGSISKTASSCPFYASPKIHNLLPSSRQWQKTAAYGGTYYGKRYPERTEYMDKIMSAAAPLGLTVYDRQHNDPESPYKYPASLGDYVAGGLSYEEMIQAYKAHPVQINVNSVLDSPTMFSRRVVETAACGSPLISGPALGMNRYLEGAGHIVHTESDAAQALENLLHHPAYRWRVALKGARAIMRAHTTQHRLVQMLRTAGMVMVAPTLPEVNLVTDEVSTTAANQILSQTVWPRCILASTWKVEIKSKLEAAGVRCESADNKVAEAGSLWLVAASSILENLEPEDFEDLIWPTYYAPQARIGFSRSAVLEQGDWPGVAVVGSGIDSGLQLIRPTSQVAISTLKNWAGQQSTLVLRKPLQEHDQAPNVTPKKTVVIAGHDLKFIKPFYSYFTQAGIRILLDFWTGHNQHNESASQRLVKQADTVFCEWMLGNAIWYGKNKQKGQKLVGRLHLQEIDHVLFPRVPFEAFETVMFVGPHILRQGIAKNPILKKNGVVVYNGVDVEALQSVPRKVTNGKVLGFVGIVPQRKRFDLALDILRELRKEDRGYILRVKGKRPEEYSWMANRPGEMAWYEAQYRRLEEDPLLKDAVIFDPQGNDMPEWYSGIDFVLSTSDFESFHFTIADGAAAGCTPIILPWEGADEIYPKEWVVQNVQLAFQKIKNNEIKFLKNRKISRDLFSINKIFMEFFEIV
ncbi:glycosyltransferase [Paenalcaligenes hominis]|uniref:glycosyltransferase n=1 Tax=Paenalcaligenes hominis TaxID=643674 RepID=UPI003526A2F1